MFVALEAAFADAAKPANAMAAGAARAMSCRMMAELETDLMTLFPRVVLDKRRS